MKSLNLNQDNCRRNGVIGLGLMPEHWPTSANIKVSCGRSQYEASAPSNSGYGKDKQDNEQNSHEEVEETSVNSKGEAAVAEVRKEVDKLEQQVSAVQAVVNNGIKVDEKGITCLTEMLMRQLLKLDGIEADGEGRAQRRAEVRRVQSIVETLDVLKSRNKGL